MKAIEKAPAKKPAKVEDRVPAGMDDEDDLGGLLDEDLDDAPPSSSSKKAAAKPKSSPPPSLDSDAEDLLPFDDMESSRGSGTIAPKAKAGGLESKGVRVGRTPTEVAEIAVSLLGAKA